MGGADGIAYRRYASDETGLTRGAIHDGCIQFDPAGIAEYGALAGVE